MLIRIMSKGYNFGCLIQRGILAITIISFYSISFFSSLYNKPIRFNFSFFVRCTFVFGLNRLFFGLCIVGKLYSTSIGCFLALIMLGPPKVVLGFKAAAQAKDNIKKGGQE